MAPKQYSKTANDVLYFWNRVCEEYDKRNPPNQDGYYKYLEDIPFLQSSLLKLVEKVDKMEKTLEGYANGKWAKEALE